MSTFATQKAISFEFIFPISKILVARLFLDYYKALLNQLAIWLIYSYFKYFRG